ncbi:MJ0042-type zinc finger domain-containing protein [Marinospirillum alkaliphilum]|uniref:MJ0042 family finger-like domain-containing protein n=1 Tax=Marinospirillum alkaliphilum DSM 21637 TaxID=1122209 RepID=A0A1K1YY92_9GAMM|nr:MJ0042-type zinc finger domain-containing protein [Marinospirillum alkaliphilum]SFX66824.1 MJ0042 family finger-like domain-containing protein [Marinospirillum alkaliphilum DSM 21637]
MRVNDQVKQTRCPHCNSVFEVTEEEMQQAFGAVRCGDCMKIFNAAYHLINTPHATPGTDEHDHTLDEDQHGIPTLHEHPDSNNPLDKMEDAVQAPAIPDAIHTADTLHTTDTQPPSNTLDMHHPLDESINSEYTSGLSTIETDEMPDTNIRDFDPLVTDSRESGAPTAAAPETSTKQRRHLLIAVLLLLPLIGFGAYWLSGSQGSSNLGYVITEIRVAPASSPQKMQVHFQLGNAGNNPLPVPDLNIELLNLSLQPVASEVVVASDISRELTVLAPGSSHALQVSVNRPATFVQTARIHPVLP